MSDIILAVQRFSKIEQITSVKDEAPPVYLMDEIATEARLSPDTALSIAEHCAKLLGHRNPIVKYKTLRLIRHLCNKGCTQFQRGMQRYALSVRELVRYKGEADPFKGDIPNQRVRDAAKEAIELIFAAGGAAAQSTSGQSSISTQGRIKGFGSGDGPPDSGSSYGGGSNVTYSGGSSNHNYGTGGSKMAGFGNDSSSSSSQPPNYSRTGASPQLQSSGRAAGNSSYGRTTTTWGAQGGSGNLSAGLNVNPTLAHGGAIHPPPDPPAGYRGLGTVSASSMAVAGSEELLVEDLCAAGGLRTVPDAGELRRFVQAVSSLDGLKIAELLREKMQAVSWQVVLRALCGLEVVLEQGMTQSCGEVAVMFQSDTDPVWQAASSTSLPVRERAAKVLKLLTGDEVQVAPPPELFKKAATDSVPSRPTPAPPSGLDLLGDLSSSPPAAPSHPVDLFAPLAPPPAAPPAFHASLAPPPAPAHSLLHFPSPTPPAAATASASFDDMFSDMNLSSVPPAAGGASSFSNFAAATPSYSYSAPPAATPSYGAQQAPPAANAFAVSATSGWASASPATGLDAMAGWGSMQAPAGGSDGFDLLSASAVQPGPYGQAAFPPPAQLTQMGSFSGLASSGSSFGYGSAPPAGSPYGFAAPGAGGAPAPLPTSGSMRMVGGLSAAPKQDLAFDFIKTEFKR